MRKNLTCSGGVYKESSDELALNKESGSEVIRLKLSSRLVRRGLDANKSLASSVI